MPCQIPLNVIVNLKTLHHRNDFKLTAHENCIRFEKLPIEFVFVLSQFVILANMQPRYWAIYSVNISLKMIILIRKTPKGLCKVSECRASVAFDATSSHVKDT